MHKLRAPWVSSSSVAVALVRKHGDIGANHCLRPLFLLEGSCVRVVAFAWKNRSLGGHTGSKMLTRLRGDLNHAC